MFSGFRITPLDVILVNRHTFFDASVSKLTDMETPIFSFQQPVIKKFDQEDTAPFLSTSVCPDLIE